MRVLRNGALLAGLFAMLITVLPASADAILRVGVDARWVPIALETMKEEGGASLEKERQLESLGIGARVLFGLERFALGPKVNFARHTFSDPDLSYSQVDINLHARLRTPTARFAFFTEAGPAVALNIGGVGYNAVLGMEVDILGWPLVDMNLGLAAQYANIPIGAGPSEVRRNHGVRGMVLVGFDFKLY